MFSAGFSSGARGGNRIGGDVFWHVEFVGGVPPGAIHQQDGMGAGRHRPADLLEMRLHGVGIGKRHDQRGAGSASRADGAEDIDTLVALVPQLPRSASGSGPSPHQTVLLTQAQFILPPKLHRGIGRQMPYRRRQRAGKVF